MKSPPLSLGFVYLVSLCAACSAESGFNPNSGVGSGGTAPGAGGAMQTPSSGGAAGGAMTGSGGVVTGTGGVTTSGELPRPIGVVPNDPVSPDLVGIPRADWRTALISPTLESAHHNQPAIINGYMMLAGNAEHSLYNIADPRNPQMLSHFVSPEHCPTCGPKGEGEAESHQVAFARYGNEYYVVTIAGQGVDIWNITDPKNPRHIKLVSLLEFGVDYGDHTNAIWGVYWQGDTIYVGGTNTGLHILDARDPNDVKFVTRMPTGNIGGLSAGPLFAVGNVLVVTTPKESGALATLDISDPHNPVLLDAVITAQKSYIGWFYRRHVYLQKPLRVWDVLSDPTTLSTSPNATYDTSTVAELHASEYMSFSDDKLFLGLIRPNPGAQKFDVSNLSSIQKENRIWGRMDLNDPILNDDQFTLAVGPLLIMADDERVAGKYAGTVIGVHSPDPDSAPPVVDAVIPKDAATGQSVKSRIGISFSDNIELATVNSQTFIVRPMGGEALAGKWGISTTVLNFDPDEDLQPGTTYEVVLPKGGITDIVGNSIAEEFRATFTTQ